MHLVSPPDGQGSARVERDLHPEIQPSPHDVDAAPP